MTITFLMLIIIDYFNNLMRLIMKRIEELKKDIADLKKQIDNFELDPYDYEGDYCNMLDEQGYVHIGSLTFSPSEIVRELDETAYQCGLDDYVDSLDVKDDSDYQKLEEELEELEDELADLLEEKEQWINKTNHLSSVFAHNVKE